MFCPQLVSVLVFCLILVNVHLPFFFFVVCVSVFGLCVFFKCFFIPALGVVYKQLCLSLSSFISLVPQLQYCVHTGDKKSLSHSAAHLHLDSEYETIKPDMMTFLQRSNSARSF